LPLAALFFHGLRILAGARREWKLYFSLLRKPLSQRRLELKNLHYKLSCFAHFCSACSQAIVPEALAPILALPSSRPPELALLAVRRGFLTPTQAERSGDTVRQATLRFERNAKLP
jgi:hypothetical protein